jgi:hypothetical protein
MMKKYDDIENYTTGYTTPVSVPMVSTTKQIGKKKKFDKLFVDKILDVQFPIMTPEHGKYKSKWFIKIIYKGKDGKEHNKTVFFGDRQRSDFIEHKNLQIRDSFIQRLKKPASEFEPEFWEYYLLNGSQPDILSSYSLLRKTILH